MLTETLRKGGYEAEAACSGQAALAKLGESPFAALLLDVIMPGMDGLQLLAEVAKRHPNVVVVMTTAVRSPDTIVQAMKLGAVDYIIKPFERDKVLLSVSAALEKRRAKLELQGHQRLLVEHVKRGSHSLKQKTREIESLLLGVIESLAYTIEAKDKWTEGHSRKVARHAVMIANELGWDARARWEVEHAGVLHDIGKLAVRESVLNKPGPLTYEEYVHVRQHPITAERILHPIEQFASLIPSVRHHHEWFDGKGYPDGLAGDAIPEAARVIAVADAYDAMTTGRYYRDPIPTCEAIEELQRMAGQQFDPKVVDAFTAALQPRP